MHSIISSIKIRYFIVVIFVFIAFPTFGQNTKDNGYIKWYSGSDVGYEYFNFNRGGGQLLHLGYFKIVRRDWEKANPYKFVARGGGIHLLGAYVRDKGHVGLRAWATVAFHVVNRKNWGDFPLIVDGSYSYLYNNNRTVNLSIGTSTLFLKLMSGINYSLTNNSQAERIQPVIALRIQFTSYQRLLW